MKYRIFKVPMLKFRCRNVKLPVEKHSYNSDNSELCTLCQLNEVADEFYVVIRCLFITIELQNLVCKRNFGNGNVYTFMRIMSLKSARGTLDLAICPNYIISL